MAAKESAGKESDASEVVPGAPVVPGATGTPGATRSAEELPAAVPPVDRRLLDEIFGDVLPETTSDEREPSGESGYSEQWYRDNRPPHHGG